MLVKGATVGTMLSKKIDMIFFDVYFAVNDVKLGYWEILPHIEIDRQPSLKCMPIISDYLQILYDQHCDPWSCMLNKSVKKAHLLTPCEPHLSARNMFICTHFACIKLSANEILFELCDKGNLLTYIFIFHVVSR